MKNLVACRINVMVSNLDRAVQFYCDTLGLELIQRYGYHYAEIQAPDLVIGLHPSLEEVIPGNSMSIGFGVRHFDQTIEDLGTKGIYFRVQEDGGVRLAHFKDVDNNDLFLAERKE